MRGFNQPQRQNVAQGSQQQANPATKQAPAKHHTPKWPVASGGKSAPINGSPGQPTPPSTTPASWGWAMPFAGPRPTPRSAPAPRTSSRQPARLGPAFVASGFAAQRPRQPRRHGLCTESTHQVQGHEARIPRHEAHLRHGGPRQPHLDTDARHHHHAGQQRRDHAHATNKPRATGEASINADWRISTQPPRFTTPPACNSAERVWGLSLE